MELPPSISRIQSASKSQLANLKPRMARTLMKQVQIAYAVECKGDRSREVDAIGVSLEGMDVSEFEDTVESPAGKVDKANMPDMTVDGAQFNPNAVFPPGKTMKLDFSNVFENLMQYRIDNCQSNGAPFVTKGCLEENWDQLGFDIDSRSMTITIAPVLAVNSKNLMEISCEVIFCNSCQGKSIDYGKLDSDDYYQTFIGLSTRSLSEQDRTLSQKFLIQPFDDPVLIKIDNLEMVWTMI
ncbi:Oidioi.mRNA.OKI2018_I69.chr1.g356.t1.cds [Oikopleura dioica]|uniref:Oidioi.mRNA.OKI2018_I69.chr1.g356.t1.cds n=1 Tax=Oikopleura dioica TaxID=34765 RepID=A0ABN7SJK6_OIKDI|nr:Oidioi.mRNA.OKI2018_I69.chr1.g356.t1.cds [Oikopleura dioica]